MSYFPKIDRWLISNQLFLETLRELALDGQHGNEGTCFWLGRRTNQEAIVSQLVLLRGEGVWKAPLNVTVSASLLRKVHDEAILREVILLAQVHSHSAECGVDMSPTDHAYGVSVPYFLSIICPDYARGKRTTIQDCGVHVCIPRAGYVRLSDSEISQQIRLVSQAPYETITVGQS